MLLLVHVFTYSLFIHLQTIDSGYMWYFILLVTCKIFLKYCLKLFSVFLTYTFYLFWCYWEPLTGLMRGNAGRISYWIEIYYTLILLRRISHLKRGKYVSVSECSCDSIQKRNMQNCWKLLLKSTGFGQEYNIFRFDACLGLWLNILYLSNHCPF